MVPVLAMTSAAAFTPSAVKGKSKIETKYQFTGFISSGTYGRVYMAKSLTGRNGPAGGSGKSISGDYAIKKFKPDKEGGERAYTGISQSAIREMAICAEVRHRNIIRHIETILEDKAIYMVFEYCDHDLLQIIHRHGQTISRPIARPTVRSIMLQLLRGCEYLHRNWIMHRDLKPANILVTRQGQVMIGDLGLARVFREPLVPLWGGDKVVVTIWYRAPELLMGARHYTPAIDLWAVGCIFAELLGLRPIFKGEEAKSDNKKAVPFQRHQMQKIVEVLGKPNSDAGTAWASLASYPDSERRQLSDLWTGTSKYDRPLGLENWYHSTAKAAQGGAGDTSPGVEGFDLLSRLLAYDPGRRVTAADALAHPYFATTPPPSANCFEGSDVVHPGRKIAKDEHHAGDLPGTKRSGMPDDSMAARPNKRFRDV